MKALKDLTWDEAEPIFRAFHAGEPLRMDCNTLTTTLAILRRDTLYALPPKPVQKTVVPAAFWELFPDVTYVACFGTTARWYGNSARADVSIPMRCVEGFVPGDDTTEVVSRPEASADDGWIDWRVGDCPVRAGAIVDVKLRSGGTTYDQPAWKWNWGPCGPSADIVAYRVVKP